MSINGKNKGSSYERHIAKILTEWSGREFTRTPGSGGLHWKENNTVSGDIVPPADLLPVFTMSLELKKQEVPWDFDFMIKTTSDILKFFSQCENDAKDFNKEPMLIFSKNHRKNYVMTSKNWFDNAFKGKNVTHMFLINAGFCPLVLFDLDDMLKNLDISSLTKPI